MLDVKNGAEPLRLVTSHDLKIVPIDHSRDTLVTVAHTCSEDEAQGLYRFSGAEDDDAMEQEAKEAHDRGAPEEEVEALKPRRVPGDAPGGILLAKLGEY